MLHLVLGHGQINIIRPLLFEPRRVVRDGASKTPLVSKSGGFAITTVVEEDDLSKYIVSKWCTPQATLSKLDSRMLSCVNSIKRFLNAQSVPLLTFIHPSGEEECPAGPGNHMHVLLDTTSNEPHKLTDFKSLSQKIKCCDGYIQSAPTDEPYNSMAFLKKPGILFWGATSPEILSTFNAVNKNDGLFDHDRCVLPEADLFRKIDSYTDEKQKHYIDICGALPFVVHNTQENTGAKRKTKPWPLEKSESLKRKKTCNYW